MQQEYDFIDQNILRSDQQLNGLLTKIRDDVMKGYVVEIKTRAHTYHQLEINSQQSFRNLSKSNSFVNNQRLNQDQIHNIRDVDEVVVISSQRDNRQNIRLANSLNQSPLKIKSEIIKPIILDNHLQSEQTIQSFPSQIDIVNPLLNNINKQLDDIETNQDTGNCLEFIKILTKIQSELQESIYNNVISNNSQITNAIQMVRTLCLLTKLYQEIADFPHAIKSLKQIKNMFEIYDPNLQGKIQIQLGKLYFLNQSYIISQQNFYSALLLYEKLQWKSEIAYILLWMAKVNAWTKNLESATKMVYGAIAIFKEYLQDDDEQIAEAYVILGECNYITKNSEQALEFLMKAIQIKFKKYNTYQHIKFIEVYNLVGLTYRFVPDISQSLYYFTQALSCFKYNCVQRAQILNNIANMLRNVIPKQKEIYTKILPTYHDQMELLNQTFLSPQ